MFRQMFEEKYMRFPQGKEKAVTFSYDDGVAADVKLLKVFEKYGLKGTFNLNSKLFDCPNWHDRLSEEQTFQTFRACGQEIANHGARHIFLNKVPLAEAIKEIADCRDYLENKFERIVDGLAYAYNGNNEEVLNILPALGITYARTTQSTRSFGLPQNWLLWHPTCHHGDPALGELTQKFLSAKPNGEFKNREPLLFYVWGHSYEFDDNSNWEIIENFGKALGGRQDVWFATNGEIYSYVKAYRSLVYSIDGERVYNPSAVPVWLDIRGKTYKIGPAQTVVFSKD